MTLVSVAILAILASDCIRTSSIRLTASVISVGEDMGGVSKPLLYRVDFNRGFVGVFSSSISSSSVSSPSPITDTRSIASTLEVAIEAESKEGCVGVELWVEGAGEGSRDVIREKELVGPSDGRPLADYRQHERHCFVRYGEQRGTYWKESRFSS